MPQFAAGSGFLTPSPSPCGERGEPHGETDLPGMPQFAAGFEVPGRMSSGMVGMVGHRCDAGLRAAMWGTGIITGLDPLLAGA